MVKIDDYWGVKKQFKEPIRLHHNLHHYYDLNQLGLNQLGLIGKKGEYRASFDEMVDLFGEPTWLYDKQGGGDGKTSTEWEFIWEQKDKPVYLDIYDYKQTAMYNWNYQRPDELRQSGERIRWSIGSNVSHDKIKDMIKKWKGIVIGR